MLRQESIYLDRNIGTFSAQGLRAYQEDRVVGSHVFVEGIEQLSMNIQSSIIRAHFKQLQDQYGNHEKVGSTACVVTAWVEPDHGTNHPAKRLKIIAASLGDSRAYLLMMNTVIRQVTLIQELTDTHKPDDEEELERIIAAGGYVKKGRLKGRLAMSRAFGDIEYDSIGLSHVPDIEFYDYELAAGEVPYIVVVSDGLDVLSEVDFVKVIREFHYLRAWPALQYTLITHMLVSLAINNYRSEDNCTAAVFRAYARPLSAAVFDGHGGDDVSEALRAHFYPDLCTHIQAVLTASNKKAVPYHSESDDDEFDVSYDGSDISASSASSSSYGSSSPTLFSNSPTNVLSPILPSVATLKPQT